MGKDGATIFYFMVTNVLALLLSVLFAIMSSVTGDTALGFIAVIVNLCSCSIFFVVILSIGGLSIFLYNGSANAAYTILDSLSTCLYRFAGLKGVVQIALIVIVYTLIDALGVAIGLIKVDAGEFVWSILNLNDVFSIIVDMLISLGIIKLVQH